MPSRQNGMAQPVLLYVLFVSFQEIIQLGQEGIAINAMDHTGLFHGLAAGSRSAKAVHADCHKQGSGMGSDMQNVANDGFFFNLDSHLLDLL